MPLLPKEADIHPESIFELPLSGWPWHVAHVRSRQEKSLARTLMRAGVPFYLPQAERVTVRNGRRLRSYLPVFAGYVFFRGDARSRDVAIRSRVTAGIIAVDDQVLLDAELGQLRQLQLAGASFEIIPDLLPGDAVRITSGAFRGYVGSVVRIARRDRLVVSISLLRTAVAVELDRPALRHARP